jgi:hypothetical protein
VKTLPPEKQSELLAIVNSLAAETQPRPPFKSLRGLWSQCDIDLSAEDLKELRREM